ncbi:uncharacterized protein LOC119683723 isoform X2 [Teleopsis dalmanni]|uniref:uncharacterized protein LOC119683701 n=1 Tax=Teleopsis dalmanni TaxID=139649 RepID=UPI0018CFDC3C|nr:uncharacterized protein LOC119683701 [Teleopsis dalmanni]XP_037953460.1 uncharacterized protein LOC119683723 isoform X2 [Teleopsis dalmanni]
MLKSLYSAILLITISTKASGQSLTNAIHRTQAAIERVNDLWCYECDTMDNGTACVDALGSNTTIYNKKCKGEEFICMVKRFSYTLSTENSTSSPKMWSLNRRCTVVCEPGCIVIGERTKLYACTSCCEKSLCNTGRGAATSTLHRVETGIGTVIFLTLHVLAMITYQINL